MGKIYNFIGNQTNSELRQRSPRLKIFEKIELNLGEGLG